MRTVRKIIFPCKGGQYFLNCDGEFEDVDMNPTAAYRGSDIDDSGNPEYYGFINADGGWYILRITDGNNLRYCKGLLFNDYVEKWDEDGKYIGDLEFDYFNNVF